MIDLPGIAEVERLASARGAMLREDDPERVAITDRVSISLFGITEADTYRPEPHLIEFLPPADRALFERSTFFPAAAFPDAHAAYDKACDELEAWEHQFDVLYNDRLTDDDVEKFWRVIGIDVHDRGGVEAKCLHAFSRQIIVVARGLLPGAVLTPDGSGKRAAPDADTWGRAMAAAARAFQERKR